MGIFRNKGRKITPVVKKEKVKIISSKEDISSLKNVKGIVHLSFRPSNMDIFKIVKSCPKMKGIEVTESHLVSISESARAFLDMHGIILRVGTIQRMN